MYWKSWTAASLTVLVWTTGCSRGPMAAQVTNGLGMAGMPGGGANHIATSDWMRTDATNKVVELRLIAGVNGRLNFNGYSNGAMNVVVPPGWKVSVAFQNQLQRRRHSAVIAPFAARSVGQARPAFIGASTANAEKGTLPDHTDWFQFEADKEGRYAIVCGVSGHEDTGMWDTFVVSSHVALPRIYIQVEG
jgi:sulfocyanin